MAPGWGAFDGLLGPSPSSDPRGWCYFLGYTVGTHTRIVTKVKGRQGRTLGSTEAHSQEEDSPLPTPLPVESLLVVHLDVLAGKACCGFSIYLLMKVVPMLVHYFFL